MSVRAQIQDIVGRSGGVLRLEPNWVPRSFMHPGRRLRLHQDDWYACGAHRAACHPRLLHQRDDDAKDHCAHE